MVFLQCILCTPAYLTPSLNQAGMFENTHTLTSLPGSLPSPAYFDKQRPLVSLTGWIFQRFKEIVDC